MTTGLDIQVQMPSDTDPFGFFQDFRVFGKIFKAALGFLHRAWIGLYVGSKGRHLIETLFR